MSKRTLRPSRTKLHRYLVSAGKKETKYGTRQDVDAALLMNRAIFPSHGAEIITDEGKVSGKPGISKTQAVTTDIMLDFGIDQLTFFELGFLLAYTFGPPQKAAIHVDDSNGSSNEQAADSEYLKFIFTPPGADDIDVTPFTFEHWKDIDPDEIDMARYRGGYIDSLNLEMNRGGNRLVNASGQMGFRSYEKWESKNTPGNIPDTPTAALPVKNNTDTKKVPKNDAILAGGEGFGKALSEKAMNAACGSVWLGQTTFSGIGSLPSGLGGNVLDDTAPSLTATTNNDISEAVQTARLNWSNNVSRGYRPGGKSNISLARRTDPTRTLDLSLEYATQAEAQAFHKQTDYAFQWNVVGDPIKPKPTITSKSPTFGLSLIIPRMRIATYDESEDEGIVNMDLGFTIMDDVSSNNYPALYAVLWLESPRAISTNSPRTNDYAFAS